MVLLVEEIETRGREFLRVGSERESHVMLKSTPSGQKSNYSEYINCLMASNKNGLMMAKVAPMQKKWRNN